MLFETHQHDIMMSLKSIDNIRSFRAVYLITFLCLCFSINVNGIGAEEILSEPVFDVYDFGAKGDGLSDDTEAIQEAIKACEGGSGTVLLQDGTFLSGTLKLGSKMNLHIAESATLLGKPYADNYRDYYPDLPIEYETSTNRYLKRALIYAYDQEEIMISGRGTIDLQAPTWKEIFYENNLEVGARPLMIFMRRCRNIKISDLKIRNAVAWCLTYDQCRNLTLENLDLYNDVIENNDGIDIVDCSHVKVLNNKIYADDDNICLKSMCAVGLKDILIQGNVLYSVRANGIKLGTDSSGPVDEVRVYDNLVMGADKAAFAWESVDGSHTNNLHIRNLEIHNAGAPLFIVLGERGRGGSPPGSIQNVKIENVRAYNTRRPDGMMIMGLPGKKLKNIEIRDCHFEMCGKVKNKMEDPPQIEKNYPECNMFGWLPAYAFFIRDVENIKFQNITVGHLHGDVRPWITTRNVDRLETENINEIGRVRPAVFDSPQWKTPFQME